MSISATKKNPGIIPARAGFTGPSRRPCSSPPDHPRSRGVYQIPLCRYRFHAGSSPLARGLLGRPPILLAGARIIPARAGFTSSIPQIVARNEDHPRSRGVYPRTETPMWSTEGSSPLARGLLCGRSTRSTAPRIIPARAGFTGNVMKETGVRQDHPRSRGVYCSRVSRSVGTLGSSPLARGLRRGKGRKSRIWGIIPARAGFTH